MKPTATAISRILLVIVSGLLLLGCNNPIAYKLGGSGIVKDYEDGKRDFWGADVTGYRLREASLPMTNWREAVLANVDLSGADLSDSVFSLADMRGANLSNANLSYSLLDGADLSGADLSQATLIGAILLEANLERANLAGANLAKARVKQLQLDEASSLQGATMPDGSIHP